MLLRVFPNHPAGFSRTDVEEEDAQPPQKWPEAGARTALATGHII